MTNLIRAELYRLSRNKKFFVCLILCIVFAIALPILYQVSRNVIMSMPEETKAMLTQPSMQQIDDTGLRIGISSNSIIEEEEPSAVGLLLELFSGNVVALFLVIFVSIFVVGEFTMGTIKSVVSKGFKRSSIYFAKLITIMIATFILLGTYTIIGFLTSTILFGVGDWQSIGIGKIIGVFCLEFILHITLASIALMIGIMIRGNAGTMATNVCLLIFGTAVLEGINMLIGDSVVLQHYWIPSIIAEMANYTIESGAIIRAIITSGIYIAGTTLIGSLEFQKVDIK